MKKLKGLLFTLFAMPLIVGMVSCGSNPSSSQQEEDYPIKVTLNEETASYEKLETFELTTSCNPAVESTDTVYVWKSSNSNVASVKKNSLDNSKATVTAVDDGECTVTCDVRSISKSLSIVGKGICNVKIGAQDIKLDKKELVISLDTATTGKINATIKTGLAVTWTSSDPTVCTVDDQGNVTALKAGTSTITVAGGSCSASCVVKVYNSYIYFENAYYTVKAGSTITPTVKGTLPSSYTIEVDDTDIATVNSSTKVVTGVHNGMTNLKITTADQVATTTIIVSKGNDTSATALTNAKKSVVVANPGKYYYTKEGNAAVKSASIMNNVIDYQVDKIGDTSGTIDDGNLVYLRYQPDATGSITYDLTLYIYAMSDGILEFNNDQNKRAMKQGLNIVTMEYMSEPVKNATPFQIKWYSKTDYLFVFDWGADETNYLKENGTHSTVLADPGVWYQLIETDSQKFVAEWGEKPSIDDSGKITAKLKTCNVSTESYGFGYLRYGIVDYDHKYTAEIKVTVDTLNSNVLEINPNGVSTDIKTVTMTSATQTISIPEFSNVNTRAFQIKMKTVGNYTFEVKFTQVQSTEPLLKLDKTSISLDTVYTTPTSQITATTENVPSPTYTWTSSSDTVATVSSSGLVTAVGAGTATITCTCTDTGISLSKTCAVTITDSKSTSTNLPTGGKHAVCCANPHVWYQYLDGTTTFNGTPSINSTNDTMHVDVQNSPVTTTKGTKYAYVRYGFNQDTELTKQFTLHAEITCLNPNGQQIEFNVNNDHSETITISSATTTYDRAAFTPVADRSLQLKFINSGEYFIKVTLTEVTA